MNDTTIQPGVAPQPDRHAILGPSSAYKWMTCKGSVALEQAGKYKDSAGNAAKAGTFQHHVSAFCLEQHKDAKAFLGYKEVVEGVEFTFDEDMAELCQVYIDTVRNYVGLDGELFVEQQLDISWLTGEPDAVGTADAVIVRTVAVNDGKEIGKELVVVDLKTGHNRVEAKNNHQLVIYSLAALKAYNEGTLTRKCPPPVSAAPTAPAADDGDDLI